MAADSANQSPRAVVFALLGVAWLTLFAVLFYTQVIWANGLQLPRLAILFDLPALLAANFRPSPGASWTNLAQRLDLLAIAGVILAAAWGQGALVMRWLVPASDWREPTDSMWSTFRAGEHCLERCALTLGVGLSTWSLTTLLLGSAGLLTATPFWTAAAVSIGGGGWAARQIQAGSRGAKALASAANSSTVELFRSGGRGTLGIILVCAPFVHAMLLAALMPPVDFDVKEYHLEGPKEYWQAGRVQFLPHNVYTSFPFLTEMLSLSAMALRGDWFRGALAGQAVLMAFQVVSAGGVWSVTRRLSNGCAAGLAVLVWLTIPWTYRISGIAYTEGALACYLMLTVLVIGRLLSDRSALDLRDVLLVGFLSGSAAACKYPGVVSAVIPVGLAVVALAGRQSGSWRDRLRGAIGAGGVFTVGMLLAFGPWLLKNLLETGNPVYPLLWSIFGGESFDAATNVRWKAAHAAPVHLWSQPGQILPDLWNQLREITLRSDWQSVLIGGLAPLSLLTWRASRGLRWLWLCVLWLLLTWCWLTHRIDRFWVPMLPLLSVLAGIGLDALWSLLSRRSLDEAGFDHPFAGLGVIGARVVVGCLVGVSLLFNLAFITTPLAGFNGFLLDETQARDLALTSSIRQCRAAGVQPSDKVLFVGEAAVFDADFPYVYNTVFDDSWFERWCGVAVAERPASEWPLRSAEEIRRTFAEYGVTHVCVHWREVLRYRLPGSYGFTDFVHPSRFEVLVTAGLLQRIEPQRPEDWRGAFDDWDSLSASEQTEIARWAPELRIQSRGRDVFRRIEVYRVLHD